MNAKVLESIKRSAAVPSIPQVVLRFLEIMQDPDFDYADLVKVFSTDPGTVGEVLRLANSALFGVRHRVASIRQALTLLGPKRTRSLLLGRYLVDAISKKQVAGLDMSYFWRRSLASSVVASHFASIVAPQRQDQAFVGALLADIGIPILAESFPEKYGRIVARFTPHGAPITPEQELDTVEVTHAQVSAMVLAHWMLPDSVARAVNLHQSLNPGEGDDACAARILRSSDRIAQVLCEVPDGDDARQVCMAATAFVGVDVSVLTGLLPTIENDIEELADALRIDVIPTKAYAVLARIVQEQSNATAADMPASS